MKSIFYLTLIVLSASLFSCNTGGSNTESGSDKSEELAKLRSEKKRIRDSIG